METTQKKRLITGQARSGTVFVFNKMRKAFPKLSISHEISSGDDLIVWPISGLSISGHNIPEAYSPVVCQLRNPAEVWRSWPTLQLKHRIHAASIAGVGGQHKAIKSLFEKDQAGWEAMYRGWHERAIEHADYVYKVEEIEEEWPKILEVLHLPQVPWPTANVNKNSRKHMPRYWTHQFKPTPEFAEFMEELGYEVPNM